MNALLDSLHFCPSMAEPTTTSLTIQIDVELLRKLEAGAIASGLSMDEHVGGLIEEAVFINSPEFFDPSNDAALEYRLIREGLRSAFVEGSIPLEDVIEELESRYGAERSSDRPSKA